MHLADLGGIEMLRNFSRCRLLSGVCWVALTLPAGAQEIQLDGIVVTSSKTTESAIDALAGASVVGKDQLDQQFQAEKVSDILNTLPGVTTQETAQDTAQAVNIRGLQDFGRVNVLIEGARQNFQRSGHAANGVFYLEPEMLSQVEVTRGPTATIYGSGAIGGVVAFDLLDADDILKPGEYAAIRSRTQYSSNGDGFLASGTGAVRVGNFDILGQVNGRSSNEYEDGAGNDVENSGDETDSALIKARLRPAVGHEITGTLIDYNSEFTDQTQTGASPRDTDVNNEQYTLGYTFQSPDNPLIDFSAKIYRNRTELAQTRLTALSLPCIAISPPPLGCTRPPFPTVIVSPVGAQRSFEIETEGFDVWNTSRMNFGDTKLALTYGGDAFQDKVKTEDIFDNGDEFTPTGERTVSGAFVQSHLTFFDTVDLITALRYDQYDLSGSGAEGSDGDRVSPKVTLGVTPLTGMTLFATYAEGYRAPSITETFQAGLHPQPAPFQIMPNPNLDAETAQNFEFGVNLKYDSVFRANDAFRGKVVVFRNKVSDYIEGVSIDPNNNSGGTRPIVTDDTFQYMNIANATLEGVEVEAAYDARLWFVGISASHIEGVNDDTDERLISIPADQITVTAGFRVLNDKLVAGARARFVDEQAPPTGVTTIPFSESYALLDLFAQYEISEQFTLNANIDNVFDENYVQYLDLQNSPGLNARVGLTMRLGAN
jgi:hemoglobin/transferrin/lactoferrin receptor protein